MDLHRYDFVVIGGGLAGTFAAIAASRLGARTALVNDRKYLGGNASPEIGLIPEGAMAMGYNRFADETGLADEVGSLLYSYGTNSPDLLAQILWEKVRQEPNLTLFLNTRAMGVTMVSVLH